MKMHTRVDFDLIPQAENAIGNSVGVQQFTALVARVLMFRARNIFLAQVKHTRPVTPPPYSESFRMRKAPALVRGVGGYIVYNIDPIADLVEFGAHPRGGPTQTLRYRPFGRALDSMET